MARVMSYAQQIVQMATKRHLVLFTVKDIFDALPHIPQKSVKEVLCRYAKKGLFVHVQLGVYALPALAVEAQTAVQKMAILNARTDNLEGRTFERWRVLRFVGYRGKGLTAYWRCKCVCGTQKDVAHYSLVNEASTSCGCRAGGARAHRRKPRLMRYKEHGLDITAQEGAAMAGISIRAFNARMKRMPLKKAIALPSHFRRRGRAE